MSNSKAQTEAAAREALRKAGPEEARAIARQLQTLHPSEPLGWILESEICCVQGDESAALAAATKALDIGVRTTRAWVQLATVLHALRCWPELETAISSAEAAASRADDWADIGNLLTRLDKIERACVAYDRAVQLESGNAHYLFNRGAARRFLGELEAAEQDYDRVITLDPRDPEPWLNRSELRGQTPERNHVAALERRLTAGFDAPIGEVPIRYALAKEYEDLGRYEESWRHLVAGAATRRRHLQYDVRIDVATVGWIIETFGRPPPPPAGYASDEPIFIVGMPRTGTTLLERVLGGSPDVFAAGELNDFARALVAAVERKVGRARIGRRDFVTSAATIDFAELGADYVERTRPRTGKRAHFTDKMPLNYLYCGLIRRALPNSRILHVTRHPLATCYSVFKILFNQGYPFSYHLDEIADYYIAYRRLMDHWHRVHPGEILDVSYERLVIDPESESRRAFEFCGLKWSARVLETHELTGATTTASAAQVRRPIYSSSIDLWRHYRVDLEPVSARLRRAGISVD